LVSKNTKVLALGTTGLLFGSGIFAANPALAVNGDTCNAGNTFGFSGPGGLDLVGLRLELDTGIKPLVCVTGDFDLGATLLIKRGVTLRGTGSAKPVFTGTEEDGVLVDIAVAKDVILENLEFRGTVPVLETDSPEQTGVVVGDPFSGEDTDGPFSFSGAGTAGKLTIRDSTFSDFGAGGISSEVDLFIEDSQFVDNSVEGNSIDSDEVGGGAVFGAQDVTIADSDFTGNEAFGEIAAAGGAVVGNTVIITGGSFVANEAEAVIGGKGVGVALGGAVFGIVVNIEGALFSNNLALSSAGVDGYGGSLGGAVFGAEEMRSEGNDFRENEAGVLGSTFAYSVGGAVSGGGSIIIENSSFEENLAYSTSVPSVGEGSDYVPEFAFALGGAVSSYDVELDGIELGGSETPVTIEGSNFEGNVVSAEHGGGEGDDDIPGLAAGGAVMSYQGLVIGTSVFQENSAGGTDFTEDGIFGKAVGGATSSFAATTVTASTFEENSAIYGGAVIAKGTEIGNSTFVNNVATNEGGAILSSGGGNVSFSTFLNNEAAVPEAGYDIPGDAIYITGDDTGDFGVTASIFAGSSGHPQLGVGVEGGDPPPVPPTFEDYGANIFSTAAEPDLTTTGDSDLNASVFGKTVVSVFGWNPSLADNGGLTHTLALRSGALAIDFVVGMDPEGESGEDQRGVTRDGRFDAGAFEFASSVGSPATSVPVLARTGPSALGLMALASGLLAALGGVVIALRGRLTRRL
jgi:hypothetical protein